MKKYTGEERRNFLNVRRTIDETMPELSRKTMRTMARMLGQDRLKELDLELGEHYGSDSHEFMRRRMAGMTPRGAAISIRFLKMRADEHNEVTLNTSLDVYQPLSADTTTSLKAAGINTVRDFILKSKQELIKCGLREEEIKETTGILLQYGIRTVDNPPLQQEMQM
ncbi:hypothetical protein KKB44_00995 [Candidatus Micrarchaeota archaeon]|nr:hypothetical protein [Candidatus Micrarchaeota archaeon]